MTEKLKLIVVEDPRDVANISKNVLISKGFDVETCPKDGKEVLKAIRMYLPDVVIVDMFMSNYDGISVSKAITSDKTLQKKPAIIVVSNYDNGNMSRDAMQAGAAYFLLKPFDYDALCEKIQSLATGNLSISRREERIPISELDLEVMVTEILHQVGVPAHIKGYHYVRTSIILSIQNREMINHITNRAVCNTGYRSTFCISGIDKCRLTAHTEA